MKLYMIRHGATRGNLESRYVGSTDEGLLEESRQRLVKKEVPAAENIYVSPMIRCLETADILYPKKKKRVVCGFAECDFGEFEYKNYQDLKGNAHYQRFIDSFGECPFPGGESKRAFCARCVCAMEEILEEEPEEDTALVVHGGTIMALLDYFSKPHRDYFEWQVECGSGFSMDAVRKNGKVYFENIVRIESDKH